MVTLRQRFAAVAGIAFLLISTLGVGIAAAQTGYPPVSTPSGLCLGGNVSAGTVSVGTTVTFKLCGPFQPGATIAIAVNGQPAGSKIANADGSVTVVITINSSTGATVNDPVNVAVNCGADNVVATGPGSAGATATSTGSFSINCAPTATSGLAFTGANVFKYLSAALVLIAIGGALVLAERRRRSHAA